MQTTIIKFGKVRSFFLLLVLILYDFIALILIWDSFPSFLWFFGVGFLVYISSQVWVTFRLFLGLDPALVIDHEGIIDNTRWDALGRIRWEEIESIKTKKVLLVFNSINIALKNPYTLIGKEKNILKRFTLLWRQFTKKTVVELQPQLLAISYNELANILLKIDLDNPNSIDLSSHLIE